MSSDLLEKCMKFVLVAYYEGQTSNEIARLKFDIPKNDDAIV